MVVVFPVPTSGQDHKTAVCRLNDCRLLHLIQLDLIFFSIFPIRFSIASRSSSHVIFSSCSMRAVLSSR